MMELQPVNDNGGVPPSLPSTSEEAGSKRFRRPSVRLGEIGSHQWNKKEMSKPSTRTRALTNLSSGYQNIGALDEERVGNVDPFGVGCWRAKKRVGSKRVRSNWVSRIGDGGEEVEGLGFRDFSREDSESPLKEEESLVRDCDGFYGNVNREFELSKPSNMDAGGVKIWLQELGLGRFWPMFEIHEADVEVMPSLTLDDLKDMGINAVGSRRKMFSAIQKIHRDYS